MNRDSALHRGPKLFIILAIQGSRLEDVFMSFKTVVRRLFKFVLYGALIVASAVVIALFSFWLELGSEETLPTPTGPYAVGRTNFHWVDSQRIDSLSPEPHTKRELVVWLWYPASKSESDTPVAYDRAEWESETTDQVGFLLGNFFWRDGADIHAHSIRNGNLATTQTRYPVILMKSGIGAMATDYTTLAEDLASHGYIVAGSDAPYSTYLVVFPDGRTIERTAEGNPGEAPYLSEHRDRVLNRLVGIWAEDCRFVLDRLEHLNSADSSSQFWNRLDMQSVGIFGHSFGGATAAQFCADDPRCKAGVNVDGAPYGSVIKTGLPKPFMFLLADHKEERDTVSMVIKSNIQTIYNSSPDEHLWISLRGAAHFNFSDKPFQNEVLMSRLSGATGSIGGRRGVEVASACLRTFFDRHLKGQSTHAIRDLAEVYPEVRFEK